jgi:DNA-binding MurR/RpiR family transcriptional regulator
MSAAKKPRVLIGAALRRNSRAIAARLKTLRARRAKAVAVVHAEASDFTNRVA